MWILRTWGAGGLRPYARKTNEEKPKTQAKKTVTWGTPTQEKGKPKTQVKNRYLGQPNSGKRQTQDPGTNSVPGAPKPRKKANPRPRHKLRAWGTQTQERTNPS